MSEFLTEYGLFLAKSLTLVAVLLVGLLGMLLIARRVRPPPQGRLRVQHLNRQFDAMAQTIDAAADRSRSTSRSQKRTVSRLDGQRRPRLFVLDFHGDVRASAVASLRQEVSALLSAARDQDEVLLRLESGGGQVHAYGLAASQLARIRGSKLRLTVAVDKIAASGGYLMASVADRIVAAPFAVLGSIGVVAQLPNFHRVLKKHEVDFEQFSAGRHKRTLTLFGQNTDEDRQKFQENVDEAHDLLQSFIANWRPSLDLQRLATGEHWYGTRAMELNLVDELSTSDDFLMARRDSHEILHLQYQGRRNLAHRLRAAFETD